MDTDLGFGRIIWVYYISILISGLLGSPWDALLLYVSTLPLTSPLLTELWFKLSLFGSLTLNLLLTLLGESAILLFLVKYF